MDFLLEHVRLLALLGVGGLLVWSQLWQFSQKMGCLRSLEVLAQQKGWGWSKDPRDPSFSFRVGSGQDVGWPDRVESRQAVLTLQATWRDVPVTISLHRITSYLHKLDEPVTAFAVQPLSGAHLEFAVFLYSKGTRPLFGTGTASRLGEEFDEHAGLVGDAPALLKHHPDLLAGLMRYPQWGVTVQKDRMVCYQLQWIPADELSDALDQVLELRRRLAEPAP